MVPDVMFFGGEDGNWLWCVLIWVCGRGLWTSDCEMPKSTKEFCYDFSFLLAMEYYCWKILYVSMMLIDEHDRSCWETFSCCQRPTQHLTRSTSTDRGMSSKPTNSFSFCRLNSCAHLHSHSYIYTHTHTPAPPSLKERAFYFVVSLTY